VPTVTVSFTPLAAHVRTARFITAAVARRAGVSDTVVDEIRLAVSEACSLAVRFHLEQAPSAPIELRLTEEDGFFTVEVADAVNRTPSDGDGEAFDFSFGFDDAGRTAAAVDGGGTSSTAVLDSRIDDALGAVDLRGYERFGLAVISGLVDDVRVDHLETGSVVTMTWPIG
jgi:serine/threonine-protein kinase RsbW